MLPGRLAPSRAAALYHGRVDTRTALRLSLLLLAGLATLAARRHPSQIPVARALCAMVLLEAGRAVVRPLAPAFPFGRIDHALLALWPAALVAGAAPPGRRVEALLFAAYALVLGAYLAPAAGRLFPGRWATDALQLLPRAAAFGVVAWYRPRGPLVLLAAGEAACAAVAWQDPARLWWLARGITGIEYAGAAGALLLAGRRAGTGSRA